MMDSMAPRAPAVGVEALGWMVARPAGAKPQIAASASLPSCNSALGRLVTNYAN